MTARTAVMPSSHIERTPYIVINGFDGWLQKRSWMWIREKMMLSSMVIMAVGAAVI
jgi:hypothetical protein